MEKNLSKKGALFLNEFQKKLNLTISLSNDILKISDTEKNEIINNAILNISEDLTEIILELIHNMPIQDARYTSELSLKKIQALLLNELKKYF